MSNSESIEFPYPLNIVHGKDAEREWERLARQGKLEGFSPVILGDQEQVERIKENMDFVESTVEEILARAEKILAEEWFASKGAEFAADEIEESEEEYDNVQGTERLTVPFEVLSQKPHKEVFIAGIPTTKSWEIPAYLKAGGWNDCPAAEEQVAVCRYWQQKFGAEIACLSGDILECIAANPPQDRKLADELARQQFLFCSDVVFQGVGSVATLGKTLLGNKFWYFWWD